MADAKQTALIKTNDDSQELSIKSAGSEIKSLINAENIGISELSGVCLRDLHSGRVVIIYRLLKLLQMKEQKSDK